MSIGAFRPHFASSLLLIVAAVALFACSKQVVQRTILDRQGPIKGLSRQALTVEVGRGDRLQVILGQAGLDLYLEFQLGDIALGRYESVTGRYGEERVQLTMPRAGDLRITVGAVRFPHVSGSYHLIVRTVEHDDPAEADYTRASRIDQPLESAERVLAFMQAAEGFAKGHRAREEGLAAFAASTLLTDTASDARKAADAGARAVAALRGVHDDLLLASALIAVAGAQGEGGQADSSALNFLEARRLFESGGSRVGVAEARLVEGGLTYKAKDPSRALADFLDVARECGDLGERVCEAYALNNAAIMQRNLGNSTAAFEYLFKGLRLVDSMADPNAFASLSDNLAFTLRMLGDFDDAIFHHERALQAYATFGECSGVSRSLYGLGYSMLGIGDDAQALRFYKLVLERNCAASNFGRAPKSMQGDQSPRALCRQALAAEAYDADDRSIATWVSWDLGNFARSAADPASALVCHEIATRLATRPGHILGTRLDTVRDLIDLGKFDQARNLYASFEKDLAKSHPWYRSQGVDVDAQLLAVDGRSKDAVARYAEAAQAYREAGNLEGNFGALARRASLSAEQGDVHREDYFIEADAALENVRLLSLDPSFSASLFSSGRRIYSTWIDEVLSGVSRDRQEAANLHALAISERSRARLLWQLTKAARVGQEARAAQLKSVASNTLAILERTESGQSPANGPTTADTDALAGLQRALGLARERFDRAALKSAIEVLDAHRRTLDERSMVVEYMLGDEHSYAWVVQRDSVRRVELAGARKIRPAAAAVQVAIGRGGKPDDARNALNALHELLWRPLGEPDSIVDVAIVPDDVLHEVPFAALWDAHRQEYLVERSTFSYIPSIQYAFKRSERLPVPQANDSALLIGDPVYEIDDARRRCGANVRQPDDAVPAPELRRLPGSFGEVTTIEATIREQGSAVTSLVGCEATRQRVLDAHPERYRFVHLATHATADRVVPQRSAIYLSQWDAQGNPLPSALTAADLLERRWRSDLVVLSGCSTAGGRQFGGEGSLGLPFSLLAGGSRQVISTLWRVADKASEEAMGDLYSALLAQKLDAKNALRATQLKMLSGVRWSHPRHWAAYALMGS